MNRFLRPLYALITAGALTLGLMAHSVNADTQPDVRAQAQSLALATANSAISVPLNYGRQLIHWQIVTGATTNAADRIIFENSPDAGTTWDGATVLQSSNGTGTSTVLTGAITAGSTFTPAASTTYDFWVPVNAMTQTRVRVSTNHAGDTAATVAYNVTSGAVPAPIGTALPVTLSLPTSLPVTVPTIAAGLAVPVAPFCPSTAPSAVNGGYSCTINSVGQLNVNLGAVASPVPVVASTWLPVAPATTFPISAASAIPVAAATTIPVSIAAALTVNTPAPAPTASLSQEVGVEPFPYLGVATPNPTSTPIAIKTGPGTLGGAELWNGSANTLFIGFYDAATTGVTLGTTVPKMVLACITVTYCFLPVPTGGVTFSTAITYLCGSALTGGVPTTACGSNTTTLLTVQYH